MQAWRISCVAPGVVSLVVSVTVLLLLTLLNDPLLAQDARCENNRGRILELATSGASADRDRQIADHCARMKELNCPHIPGYCATGIVDPICWNWTWTLDDKKTTGGTTVTMSPDGTIKGKDYGLSGTWKFTSGTWKTDGSIITVDWGRGPTKEDTLTLSKEGKTLMGKNFQTTEQGIVANRKPCEK